MSKLTALGVKKAGPGKYGDGGGLYLVVSDTGSRKWVLRIQVNGNRRDLGLGAANKVTLSEAREAAEDMRRAIRRGEDPVAEKRRARATMPTFREAAIMVHQEHRPSWKNPKHARQWLSTLEAYVFPQLGDLPVNQIDGPMVRDVLVEIWLEIPVVEVPARILWVANEERVDDIRRRCKAVALQHGLKGGLNWVVRGKDEGMLQLVSLNENGQPELNAEAIATLVAEIRKAGADAFVMDPYVTISNAVDENSAVSATMITKGLNIVTQMTGAVAIHAHHTPKSRNDDGDWYRGSSDAWRGSGAIFSALDCAFTLSHFIPLTKDQRKAWKALTLSGEEEMPTPDHSEG